MNTCKQKPCTEISQT